MDLLCLDTEFIWRNTYRPLLCIVQTADAANNCKVIDCLKGQPPPALAEALRDAGTVKILHDARQDLQYLSHYTGALPVNVFDTQLAAAFAGFRGRISLQELLISAINVGLPKTQTLTDWSQRPLTAAQLDYALDDVRYLAELRQDLLRRADELGTREWLETELQHYDEPTQWEDINSDDAWLHIKSDISELPPKGCAALQLLAAAREEQAREWNLPKNWLGDDTSLVNMAFNPDAKIHFHHRLRNRTWLDMLTKIYEQMIAAAMDFDEEDCPPNPCPRYPSDVITAAKNAMEFIRERAETLHVDHSVITNRATLTAFLDTPEDDTNPLASGWRYEVIGKEILSRFAI